MRFVIFFLVAIFVLMAIPTTPEALTRNDVPTPFGMEVKSISMTPMMVDQSLGFKIIVVNNSNRRMIVKVFSFNQPSSPGKKVEIIGGILEIGEIFKYQSSYDPGMYIVDWRISDGHGSYEKKSFIIESNVSVLFLMAVKKRKNINR